MAKKNKPLKKIKKEKKTLLNKILADGKVTKKETKQATKKGISISRLEKAQAKKKEKRIGKVISDAKITRKETRKAAEKGIKLGRIQKAMAKEYRPQQQKAIRKIIADEKVTKKEARKATKKGVTLDRLERAQIRSYKPDTPFSRLRQPAQISARVRQNQPLAQAPRPTYTPLLIKGGAQKVFDRPVPKAGKSTKPVRPAAPTPTYTPEPLVSAPPTPTTTTTPTTPSAPSAEETLTNMIGQLQQTLEDNILAQQTENTLQNESSREQISALAQLVADQQQVTSAQQQLAGRPSVLGVQLAQSSAGSPTQIASRGLSGAFGRQGLRIQSLNV